MATAVLFGGLGALTLLLMLMFGAFVGRKIVESIADVLSWCKRPSAQARRLSLKLEMSMEAAKLRERLDGIANGVSLTHNRAPDPEHWADVVADLKAR